MEPRSIPTTMTTTFEYEYATAEADLRRLYENAKRDQWNATKDISWERPVDVSRGLLADELVDAGQPSHAAQHVGARGHRRPVETVPSR